MSDSEEKEKPVVIVPYHETAMRLVRNVVLCDKCKQERPLFDSRLPLCKQCTKASFRVVECFFCGGVPALAFGDELKRMPRQICCGKCWDRVFPSSSDK